MTSRFELAVIRDGAVQHSVAVAAQPLGIGRGASNDLVLTDGGISWHHAQVWVEGGTLWVRDLTSRNGTFLNNERIRTPTPLKHGDVLGIGGKVELRVVGEPGESMPASVPLMLEVVSTGVRFALRSDRFLIGSGPDADLRLESGPEHAATLMLHANGEIWVGTDESEWSVDVGKAFEVAGLQLKMVAGTAGHAPTVDFGTTKYPYRLTASRDGASGPQAMLDDPDLNRNVLLTGNRGVLLYLLAHKLQTDRAAGLSPSEEGWCSDSDISVGIWGKGAGEANNLHVLVYRLRKSLKKAGFNPWFIEKRHWGIRVRIQDLRVD